MSVTVARPVRTLSQAPVVSRVTPNNVREFQNVLSKFNFGDDCPIFSDMWDYCRQYAGASLMAARKLISGTTDIAINWTGGLHHAKKAEASGFCYVNGKSWNAVGTTIRE